MEYYGIKVFCTVVQVAIATIDYLVKLLCIYSRVKITFLKVNNSDSTEIIFAFINYGLKFHKFLLYRKYFQ